MGYTYAMADIHGERTRFHKALETIKFSDDDELYIIGDVIDRGRDFGLRLLLEVSKMPNVHLISGNHEYMALRCLSFLMKEITNASIEGIDENVIRELFEWQNVGGQVTIDEFHHMSYDERLEVLEYLGELPLYAEVTSGGKDYILVHAGLDNFDEQRPLNSYTPAEVMGFYNVDFSRTYFKDKSIVTGHLPTRCMYDNPCPDKIFKMNNNIAIDCGCSIGGNLGVLRLGDEEEFYV